MIHHKRRMEMLQSATPTRISRSRFAQEKGFDARRCHTKPVSVKNFFIAKNRDSESAQRPFRVTREAATSSAKHRSMNAQVAKNTVSQAFSATLMFAPCEFSRIPRLAVKRVHRADRQCAPRDVGSSRKHFLKRGAVFFDALVYSGCSAFRFPDARSEQPSHYIRRATWRRKLRRRQRAQ